MSGRVPRGAHRTAGFSLVELMVALVIGLAVTLAVTMMLRASEANKRDLGATQDMSANAMYGAYVLDRLLRSAGSGYVQSWASLGGCRLHAARDGAQRLPRTKTFPAPFGWMPWNVRLTPVLIYPGAGTASDMLVVMTGHSGYSEAPVRIEPDSASSAGLRLPNTIGVDGDSLMLLTAGQGADCLVQQVQAGKKGGEDQAVPFGGALAAASVAGVTPTQFGDGTARAVLLGAAQAGSPQFQFIGVQGNGALVSLDLLAAGDAPVPLADNVVEMRALYGVDDGVGGGTADDGVLDRWVDPRSSPYTVAELTDGTATAAERLGRIVALRVGLVLRTAISDRRRLEDLTARGVGDIADAAVLFDDARLGGDFKRSRTLSGDERGFRYRTIELTVPLRNQLL